MAEQQTNVITEAESFDEKWQAFIASLTAAEQALLEQRLAAPDDDVRGFVIKTPAGKAAARPRPGSSAQPPR